MSDVDWLLQHVTDDAEICSEINGSLDSATLEARRIETTVVRLVREATEMRSALQAIAGDIPWPDPDQGFVDLARSTLNSQGGQTNE